MIAGTMSYVIDGYNLLYALGRLTARSGRGALEGARRWLLIELRQALAIDDVATVVFDAASGPRRKSERKADAGIHFVFAHGQTADDLIEELIAEETQPRQLTVVSDDHRLQQAGRRRGCNVQGCLDFYEQLVQGPPPPRTSPPPADPVEPRESPEEVQRWLETFGEVDDDPLMRDPF